MTQRPKDTPPPKAQIATPHAGEILRFILDELGGAALVAVSDSGDRAIVVPADAVEKMRANLDAEKFKRALAALGPVAK